MTAATAAPTFTSAFYAGPPPPPTASTVRPEQQPPQLAYGWWVDVLPPRGPYLWPCHPDDYEIAPPISAKHDHNNNRGSSSFPMDTADSSASSSHSASFLAQPPQMAFGWFCAEPPRAGPFFWSCLPPGYQLVPNKQWEHMLAASRSVPLTTTTRQGNVILTLPTNSASRASSTLTAASSGPPSSLSPLPPVLPSLFSTTSDSLISPSPTLSLSSFYPASKTHSISGLLASPPPPASLSSDSLSFLSFGQSQPQSQSQSQSQDADSGVSSAPPLPSRSPALEGLAAVAGEERGDGGGGSGTEFRLDSVAGSGGGGASLGSVGEGEEGDGEEDDGGQPRRGKRKRTAKARG